MFLHPDTYRQAITRLQTDVNALLSRLAATQSPVPSTDLRRLQQLLALRDRLLDEYQVVDRLHAWGDDIATFDSLLCAYGKDS